jgi:hypothetical protein
VTAEELEGYVSIEVEGRPYRLRYTQKALRLLLDAAGLPTLQSLSTAMGEMDPQLVVACVWSGLQHGENPPAIEEVEDWFYPMAPMMENVTKAIGLAMHGGSKATAGPRKGSRKNSVPTKKSKGIETVSESPLPT